MILNKSECERISSLKLNFIATSPFTDHLINDPVGEDAFKECVLFFEGEYIDFCFHLILILFFSIIKFQIMEFYVLLIKNNADDFKDNYITFLFVHWQQQQGTIQIC